jgi:CheY-like chemotaxis protein
MAPAHPVHTILVVASNDAIRAGFGATLRECGYRAALVPNGQEALDYLQDYPEPEFVLLELNMPGLEGWRFLRELHRHDRERSQARGS